MLLNCIFLFCLIFTIIPTVTFGNHVPVLLWSTQSSMWAPAASSGHVLSAHKLHMILQPVITPNTKNIVLFLQDTLSIDDFTYYSSISKGDNPWHNLQELMNSSTSSTVLTAVDSSAINNLPSYLKTQEDWNIIQIDNLDISSLEVDRSKSNLIIMTMQPIPRFSEQLSGDTFSANDKQIGSLTKFLSERGIQYTAIYTGMKPSKVFTDFYMAPKLRRKLLSTDATVPYPPLNVTDETYSSNSCIVFYATQILLTANLTITIDLTNLTFGGVTPNTSKSYCTANESVLSLLYDSPVHGINTLELRFEMSNMFYSGSARNWFKIDTVNIIHDNVTATFDSTYASAPSEYSYHCQKMGTGQIYGEILVPNKNTPDADNWLIVISEFQIQGFNINNSIFSYSSDCTGFFSEGIWMGLVSSLVLLWVLAYGIFMIMQLTTNDRFDDPKGPALSVPQTE